MKSMLNLYGLVHWIMMIYIMNKFLAPEGPVTVFLLCCTAMVVLPGRDLLSGPELDSLSPIMKQWTVLL